MAEISNHLLDKLKIQREKLNARIQKQEAQLKTAERKKETRRKILVGSYFLDHAVKQDNFDDLKTKMDTFLTRNSDRLLFDLPLLAEG